MSYHNRVFFSGGVLQLGKVSNLLLYIVRWAVQGRVSEACFQFWVYILVLEIEAP